MDSLVSNRIRTLLLNRPAIRTSMIGCNPILRPSEVSIPEYILSSFNRMIQGEGITIRGNSAISRSKRGSLVRPFTLKAQERLRAELFLSLITTLNRQYQHKYKPVSSLGARGLRSRKYNTRKFTIHRSNIGYKR